MREKMQLQQLKKKYAAYQEAAARSKELMNRRESVHAAFLEGNSSHLKKELRTLDHQLDALGEDHEEKLEQVQAELITLIRHTYPDSAAKCEKLQKQIASDQEEERRCALLLESLRSFAAALNEGSAAKHSRGLISLLLGRNSKVILARAIRKAAVEAERIYTRIDDDLIRSFLDTFLEEANRPWNSQLYKGHFFALHATFCDHVREIKEKRARSRAHKLQAELELEEWIQKYS
ncbi:MAG: hypothetical protein S4CHLAM2_08060 [Chlamydiales bacterium]|nr:hypothetical protein [Chlamydiales bacterium]